MPARTPELRPASARRAALGRWSPDSPETAEADRDYRADALAEHVARVVETFPR